MRILIPMRQETLQQKHQQMSYLVSEMMMLVRNYTHQLNQYARQHDISAARYTLDSVVTDVLILNNDVKVNLNQLWSESHIETEPEPPVEPPIIPMEAASLVRAMMELQHEAGSIVPQSSTPLTDLVTPWLHMLENGTPLCDARLAGATSVDRQQFIDLLMEIKKHD